jgi:hypothetical protein
MGPHAALASLACCPPRGLARPWGGPAGGPAILAETVGGWAPSPHSLRSLAAPQGGWPALGAARRAGRPFLRRPWGDGPPRRNRFARLLPPEGAGPPLGRPGGRAGHSCGDRGGMGPLAALASLACCPPRGLARPWGGPAGGPAILAEAVGGWAPSPQSLRSLAALQGGWLPLGRPGGRAGHSCGGRGGWAPSPQSLRSLAALQGGWPALGAARRAGRPFLRRPWGDGPPRRTRFARLPPPWGQA